MCCCWSFDAAPDEFRTGWFVESLLTELVIALVVRTRRPFFRSRPGRFLLWSTAATCAVAFALPYSPLAPSLGFAPLPPVLVAFIAVIVAGYVVAAESLKRAFYRRRRAGAPAAARGAAIFAGPEPPIGLRRRDPAWHVS